MRNSLGWNYPEGSEGWRAHNVFISYCSCSWSLLDGWIVDDDDDGDDDDDNGNCSY